jgi:Leucine-rich repeat (LRR) protein
MDVGLNACSEEPVTVLTCDNNPVTQHLVTLSVQDCPANASLTDLDFGYLSTVHLSHLSFMNCADVAAPSEPPKNLTTSLLDFFLMDSFSPIDAWWLGRLHALQNLTVLDVTVSSGSSALDVILPNMDNLRYLMIQNATLSGPLPAAWPQNLNIISLSSNYLFGEIPVSLSKLKLLEVLDLSHNQLSGHLPSYVGNLRNLQTLFLNNNGFTGGIPKQFANLRALTKLDLSFNNLNGSIPEELATLALTDLDLRNNTLLTGAIPFSTNALRNMKSLLVSGTSLCYDPTITSAKLASFLSVPLCGGIAPTLAPAYGPALAPSPAPAPEVAGSGHKKKPNVVAIVLSVLAVLVVLAGVVYCCCRWWGAREGYA